MPGCLPQAAKLIVDLANEILVSVASLWEIATKHALDRGGPNDVPISARKLPSHVVAIEQLPRLHADPFDRLLIGQRRCPSRFGC